MQPHTHTHIHTHTHTSTRTHIHASTHTLTLTCPRFSNLYVEKKISKKIQNFPISGAA